MFEFYSFVLLFLNFRFVLFPSFSFSLFPFWLQLATDVQEKKQTNKESKKKKKKEKKEKKEHLLFWDVARVNASENSRCALLWHMQYPF